MFRTCLYFSLIFFSLLWKECDPLYIHPQTQNRMKQKIIHMEMELVKDVIMKIKAVHSYKDMYFKSVVFQAGQLMHFVKMRMNRMNYLYLIVHHNVTNVTDIKRKEWNLNQTMDYVFEVEKMCMELDLMVEVMEEYDIKREDKYAVHERMRHLRSGPHDVEDETIQQMRAFHADMEKTNNRGKKRKKPRKWQYGGDDSIGNLLKQYQNSENM